MLWRGLTSAEAALADEMFGAALDVARVRILFIPIWRRAFVAGPRLLVWPKFKARADFAAPDTPLAVQAVFVHELTHVWQAQNGVRLLLAKLRAGDRPSSYTYDLRGDGGFVQLNIEQQAMVVEHAFLASRGIPAPHDPEVYAALRGAWRREDSATS